MVPAVPAEGVAAAHDDRDAEATPLQITVDESGTSSWARGAAAVAIQHALARFTVAD